MASFPRHYLINGKVKVFFIKKIVNLYINVGGQKVKLMERGG
jgi:hypothetical protein